jgi:paraquat-inducible protein A
MTSLHEKTAVPNTSQEESDHTIAACPGCDLLIVVPSIPDGHYLACGRCGSPIFKKYQNSIDRVLILSITGLLLYLPAILLPLMTLSSIGFEESGSVLDSFINFYRNGYFIVAFMVFLTAVIFPFLKLFLPFATSLCLRLNKRPGWLKSAFRFLGHLEEWGMVEVYLLGILITLIKMGGMASIDYNAGFFCFIALVMISMATTVNLDRNLFWSCIDSSQTAETDKTLNLILSGLKENPDNILTAANSGLIRCHDCGKLNLTKQDPQDVQPECSRCHAAVHQRNKNSIRRTWALVITSFFIFIPANTFPIMRVDFLGVPDRSTILDGILYFFKDGSYGIGIIILIASILVPLFKMIGLMIILLTITSGKNHFLKQKAKMFRFIEFIGRWSMLDIFVIALLTVMVDFGFLTSIHTAPGATYFCIVVAATMIAAIVFDPRIMWDRCASTQTNDLHIRENYASTAGS